MFEEVEHSADVALRVHAPDLRGLFVAAAQGLFHLMGADPQARGNASHRVELDAPDVEALLVDWLNELIFLRETENEQYTAFEITDLTPTHLTATVRGAGATGLKGHKIKAATFSDLKVEQTSEGYAATIVFDV